MGYGSDSTHGFLVAATANALQHLGIGCTAVRFDCESYKQLALGAVSLYLLEIADVVGIVYW